MSYLNAFEYVIAQFKAMGATPTELENEYWKLLLNPEYLTEWAKTTGYYK
jgi:hypothetical protein